MLGLCVCYNRRNHLCRFRI